MNSAENDKPAKKAPTQVVPTNVAKSKQKRLGHRRVNTSTGETTFKKTSSEALSCCIQLGISHTVAKLSSKPERDVLMQDFQTVESIPFPVNGSNITPAHHHGDFTFSTYAPTAFRYFRDLFGIQPEDYMLSISRHPLVELSNPGASGSLFFVTHDDEFIIKTVTQKEATFLQQLLPGYYMNIVQNPRTLLPKFYGLYTVNAGTRHNIRVVVMNNLLPRRIQMHLKFDLKGSTYKRKASKGERLKKVPTFKDLDLIGEFPNGLVIVTSDIHEILTRTLERDCLVLQSFKIMDYSLLLAIHNIDKCKNDTEPQCTDTKLADILPTLSPQQTTTLKSNKDQSATQSTSHNNLLGVRNTQSVISSTMLRNKYSADLDHWSGGIPAKNSKGERLLIFCGIIDILQCYKWKKKLEHRWKSLVTDGDAVSVHRPSFYCDRFLKFMVSNVFKEDESSIKTVRRSTSHRKPNQLAITSTTSDNFKNKSEKLPPETANQKTDGKNEVKSKLSESKTQTNNVKPETLTSKVLSDSQLTSKNENLSENKEENSLKKSPSENKSEIITGFSSEVKRPQHLKNSSILLNKDLINDENTELTSGGDVTSSHEVHLDQVQLVRTKEHTLFESTV